MESAVFLYITGASVAMMLCGWIWSFFRRRAEIVDVLWSIGTGAAGIYCAIMLSGDVQRRFLLGALCAVWGGRLGLHLFKDRVLAAAEDGRYADLRKEWGTTAHQKFLLFFFIQALLVPFLATAFFAVAANPRPLAWYDFLSVGLALLAIGGETISDRQLAKFKAHQKDGNTLCRIGVWSWSRHPNYFFEWVFWLCFPILAWGSPYMWMAFISPTIMFYLIRYVTGVPPSEERMLKNRGEAFKQYQSEVNTFFPWPPKIES